MMVTMELSNDYGYVLLTAVGSVLVSVWHGSRVIGFRKRANVPLPHAYASHEQIESAKTKEEKEALNLFNCAQRAHYNFLENYPMALALMLASGVAYPRTAAGMGAFWCVNRVLYAIGYTNAKKKEGKGRYLGGLHLIPFLGLTILTGKLGWDMINA